MWNFEADEQNEDFDTLLDLLLDDDVFFQPDSGKAPLGALPGAPPGAPPDTFPSALLSAPPAPAAVVTVAVAAAAKVDVDVDKFNSTEHQTKQQTQLAQGGHNDTFLVRQGSPNTYFRNTFCGIYWRNTNHNLVGFPVALGGGASQTSYLNWLQSIPSNDRKRKEQEASKSMKNVVTIDVTDCCGSSSKTSQAGAELVVLGVLQKLEDATNTHSSPFVINSKISSGELNLYLSDHPEIIVAAGKTLVEDGNKECATRFVAEMNPKCWKYMPRLHPGQKQEIDTLAIHDLNRAKKAGLERFY